MNKVQVIVRSLAPRGRVGGVEPGLVLKRALDLSVSVILLLLLSPLVLVVALCIIVDSSGSPFFLCPRVGFRGRQFRMVKFRKMRRDAEGPALTVQHDERFTRLGRFLANSKLDELPQLWNVVTGRMSLVGPRPEDPHFVALRSDAYGRILAVKPGITGLSQLAFAREAEILDPDDRVGDYVKRLLPAKLHLDTLYADRWSVGLDLRILRWTAAAVLFRRNVAVHRSTGELTLRHARGEEQSVGVPSPDVV